MLRRDLLKKVILETECTAIEADDYVTTIFDSISNGLVAGERVDVRGFGSFRIKKYGGKTGRNPKTGTSVHVPARLGVKFKHATALISTLNPEGIKKPTTRRTRNSSES